MTGIINRTIGQAEAAIGNAVGHQGMKERGEANIIKGEVKSSDTASVGPLSGTTSGGFAKENSERTKGNWDQTVGSGKEKVGRAVGSESLQQSGLEQHAGGIGKEKYGQAADAIQGAGERIQGTVGGLAAAATGNDVKKREMDRLAEDGKARHAGLGNTHST